MKSGIIGQSSVWDSLHLDPELKSCTFEPYLEKSTGEEFDQFDQPPVDEALLDFYNWSDSQLENIILSGNSLLCDWEKPLCLEGEEDTFEQLPPTYPPPDYFTDSFEVENVANYEEVITCNPESPSTFATNSTEYNGTDSESDCSYECGSTKRKQFDEDYDEKPRKRRRVAARFTTKRTLDQRVKTQNKIAAQKYRIRKREEKNSLEDTYQIELDRNKELKELVEEKTNEIKVLKEVLGKYLDAQLINKHNYRN